MKLIIDDVALYNTKAEIHIEYDAQGKKVLDQARADATAAFFVSLGNALRKLEDGEAGQLSLVGTKKASTS